ncbi:Glycerate 2-kinase [Xanthomonas sacchari]|uniref:glycerate kinase n=1 Tax=Xanthomonas sacchari TaxID=56458 RepID=UPI00224D431E|nr:glycerate kinase [Xanthomonas sacchari]MCW0393478.1 Glycerate 2-kinase [Xanthomonas sacchari]MCW0445350.1 Glycerate 2-kinase [Xanthomonas sacchari]
MKIVIAPDAFKESLSAAEAAAQIAAGFRSVFPEAQYVLLPFADGGEGTVDALVAAGGGRRVACTVTGPLGAPVAAQFGLSEDGGTALIEMAAASGLMLVPPQQRDPCLTGTRGVGELILAALDAGARRLLIGIGGSASNDGGAGMAQALGVRLLDAHGRDLAAGGAALAALARIDLDGLDPRLRECTIEVACDVDNPLTGPSGASAVFGPQKGATPAMVAQLDVCLQHYAEAIERSLGVAVAQLPGAGAGGGIGAALVAFLGARLRPGVEIVAQALGLEAHLAGADLLVTGEGRLDGQSAQGKVPVGLARIARRHGVPVLAIAGGLGEGAAELQAQGIDALFGAVQRVSTREAALADAADALRQAARNVAAAIALGQRLGGSRAQ